jgi:hypothetical protein
MRRARRAGNFNSSLLTPHSSLFRLPIPNKNMRLAFILDPLESIKTEKDSSYAMMREAARRGYEVHVL